ncbi:hypothetical protein [Caballeronia sp. dw_19]|uniref:hypothetical protein n=1 Tax=unclassified Caballeronia TaxID=2646786 RepID=UPI001BCD0BB1|nr:hypothetical protein [Caballeronia sp. dw_19]
MGSFFVGTVVTAGVLLMLDYASTYWPLLATLNAFEQVLAAGVISIILLNARPLALKTIWAHRRDEFLLDEDLNTIIRGRTFGVPAGVIIAILIKLCILS